MTKKQNLRSLRQAAMSGDEKAARALLRLYNQDAAATELKDGKPWSNRVRRAVDVLTAGTGALGTIGRWEHVESDGTITNDLQRDPPTGKDRVRPIMVDD